MSSFVEVLLLGWILSDEILAFLHIYVYATMSLIVCPFGKSYFM